MAPEDDQLYVRINQQEEMLGSLENLENIVRNINEASEILKQVRQVKITAIDTMSSNIQKLNENLEDFQMAMPEVEGQPNPTSEMVQPEVDDVEPESSVNEIHEELEDLQQELSKLGGK